MANPISGVVSDYSDKFRCPVTPDKVTTPHNVTSTDNVTPNLPIM